MFSSKHEDARAEWKERVVGLDSFTQFVRVPYTSVTFAMFTRKPLGWS